VRFRKLVVSEKYPWAPYLFCTGVGGIIVKIWEKYFSQSFEKYGYTCAAGLMTGEGIAGLFQALLLIMGLNWQSDFGLPGNTSTNFSNLETNFVE
jgi:hypothetical protein